MPVSKEKSVCVCVCVCVRVLPFYHRNSAARFVANVAFSYHLVERKPWNIWSNALCVTCNTLPRLAPHTSLYCNQQRFRWSSVSHPISVAFPWQCRRTSPGKKLKKVNAESSSRQPFCVVLPWAANQRPETRQTHGNEGRRQKHNKNTCFFTSCFCHFAWKWVEPLCHSMSTQEILSFEPSESLQVAIETCFFDSRIRGITFKPWLGCSHDVFVSCFYLLQTKPFVGKQMDKWW